MRAWPDDPAWPALQPNAFCVARHGEAPSSISSPVTTSLTLDEAHGVLARRDDFFRRVVGLEALWTLVIDHERPFVAPR